MQVEKTVNLTLNSKEKEIVKKFDMFISNMCRSLRSDCDICPIKKQCGQVAKALGYLQAL